MVFIFLNFIFLIGLLSYYIIFSRIRISSFDLENNSFNEGVSVIICAKNELKNIKTFFPSWINQEYSNFEIIIVNDQSIDGSFEYLNDLEKQYPKLRVLHISKNETKVLKGKRHALLFGIQNATNNYILLTDADCEPNSKFWITEMTKAFANKKIKIVLGFSPYFRENTFLNKLIQYETFLTALQYLGWANIGKPYMSVGRNVAYKKSILTPKSFTDSNKSISGDDDLVFQQIAKSENVAYNISQNAWVFSLPPKFWKEWFFQKKRHLSAGVFYSLQTKVFLGVFIILNFLFFIFSTALLVKNPITGLAFYISKYQFFSILLNKSKLLNINFKNFIKYYTIIDIIYWLFYSIFALALTQ